MGKHGTDCSYYGLLRLCTGLFSLMLETAELPLVNQPLPFFSLCSSSILSPPSNSPCVGPLQRCAGPEQRNPLAHFSKLSTHSPSLLLMHTKQPRGRRTACRSNPTYISWKHLGHICSASLEIWSSMHRALVVGVDAGDISGLHVGWIAQPESISVDT